MLGQGRAQGAAFLSEVEKGDVRMRWLNGIGERLSRRYYSRVVRQ